MGAVKDVELDRESIKVYQWRLQWLRSGGWSKRNAELIAGTEIDWRYANQLLRNCLDKGYDEEFAVRFLF